MRSLKKLFSTLTPTDSSAKKSPRENIIDSSIFDQPFYEDITDARVKHLDSMELMISKKTVADLGCGIGRISEYFVNKGCDVLCIDGRSENIDKLGELYPTYRTKVVNLETQNILDYGRFDIISCYGLLYHLSDPFGLIKNIQKICNEIAIIETCITDSDQIVLRLVQENLNNPTQSIVGMGCRPSPLYIITCLKLSGFKYVYIPKKLPNHEQFQYKRINDFSYLKNGKLIRGIYVASHYQLNNSNLQEI